MRHFLLLLLATLSLLASGVSFSHESGFYADEFELELKSSGKIYYTLDGSTPDVQNLNGKTYSYKNRYAQPPAIKVEGELLQNEYKTHLYTSPIAIKDRTSQSDRISQILTTYDYDTDYFPTPLSKDSWQNSLYRSINIIIEKLNRGINKMVRNYRRYVSHIDTAHTGNILYIPTITLDYKEPLEYLYKGTPVRAMSVDLNGSQSEVVSKIYFIDRATRSKLPIVNFSVDERLLYDYYDGFFVAGVDYDEWIASGGARKSDAKSKLGANWKRETNKAVNASITLIDGEALTTKDIRLKPNGSTTLGKRSKSIRVYPPKSGLDFDVFGDGSTIKKERLVFRNGGQECRNSFILDAALQASLADLSFTTQRYRSYASFINGEYNGILNARDRIDNTFIASKYNLPSKKIDFIKADEIKNGDRVEWDKLVEFVKNADKRSDEFYDEVASKVDLDSFMEYQIAQIYIANDDWPHNNVAYWRYRGTAQHPITDDGYTDGKWRWILYDTDQAAQNSASFDGIKHATTYKSGEEKYEWATILLRSMLENPRFKEEFVVRFSDLLNSYFEPSRLESFFTKARDQIASEMSEHIRRWSTPSSLKHWHKSIDDLVKFFYKRPSKQIEQLRAHFDLGGTYDLNIETDLKLDLNSLKLEQNFSGKYFKKLPIKVVCDDERFDHWLVDGKEIYERELRLKPDSTTHIKAVAKLF